MATRRTPAKKPAKRTKAMPSPASSDVIDAYLAALAPEQAAALTRLRAAIRAAAPGAQEGLSYGMPAFRLNGRPIAGFAASATHCAFHPMSGSIVAAHEADLYGYDTSKGTIRFPPDRPLPAALVRKLVKARIAETRGAKG